MSVTVTKGDGVTVITMASNHKSNWPPICQILGALCYSPSCCSLSQHLRTVQGTSQSALGAMQIMVGLLNIGLAAILLASGSGSGWQMDWTLFPFWLGALFIAFGISCILSEKFPSPCLVIVNVALNLVGVAFAIAAIVLYSINLADVGVWWMCRPENDYYWSSSRERTTQTPSTEERAMQVKCEEGKDIILMLLRSINVVLIVVSVLQLCITISAVVLGIKSLKRKEKQANKSFDDREHYKPLLEEVTTNPIA